MPSKLSHAVAAFSLTAMAVHSAHAVLYKVDPGPYDLSNGYFAVWYQDTHGRVLDLCLSKTVSSRVPGTPNAPSYMCSLLPAPGIFDASQPLAFPHNFPDEAFWFTADATLADAARGVEMDYLVALEAAFNSGLPLDNDQVSFARIRIRADLQEPGIYTVTHPYGTELFEVTAEDIGDDGDRAINMTRDLGIGAPQIYTGALTGDIGPFLRSVNGPYVETNPETMAQETFIGDPNLEEAVTGSPFGTNYVRLQGPNGLDVRTELFAISGRLSSTVSGDTPLIPQRATYSRENGDTGVVAQQDVFVLAPPPPGLASYVDTAGVTVAMTESTATGNWYGQSSANPELPASVSLSADNELAIPGSVPGTATAVLTDLVQIHRAEYSLSSAQLSIEASSSDQITPPVLTATFDYGALIGALNGEGSTQQLNTGVSPIPPAHVTVTSANGGSDTEEVVILP